MSAKLAINGGTPVRQKPFTSWPNPTDADAKALLSVLWSGQWWHSSFGVTDYDDHEGTQQGNVSAFQQSFANYHACRFGIAGSSGSACLDAAVRALKAAPGDEVIVPAYSFVTSATCVLQSNLIPVFVDIMGDTYNIDPACIEQAITQRTRAIIVVHFAGQIAVMEKICGIAKQYGLAVIEDASHAHGASRSGSMAGSFGDCGVFSFQASKNMTSGEGGCIVTNDGTYANRIESLMWAGRKQGQPWYEHYCVGWNSRMTEFQGALLNNQLQQLDYQNKTREHNVSYLTRLLEDQVIVKPLARSQYTTSHSNHLFVLKFKHGSLKIDKKEFAKVVRAEGIPIGVGYGIPLYKNPVFLRQCFISGCFPLNSAYHPDLKYDAFEENCPVAERACAEEALWLPHQLFLGDETDIQDIAKSLLKVIGSAL